MNCQSLYLSWFDVDVACGGLFDFEGRAGSDRGAFSTVDQSDIRGSSRIIVIRRELPHTRDAGLAIRPVA